KHFFWLARCTAGSDYRCDHHGDDRRFHRSWLLHHDLEHALLVFQYLCCDLCDWRLWVRARSGFALAAAPRRLLATGDILRGFIGKPLRRREDIRLVRGQGRYVDDIRLPGMAWCVFVRSPHAHARIRSIETRRAAAMPGVLLTLTAA